ncbi:MAG: DUF1343 domain-containing protein [Acidobacteria bacterium]|nr:MAG: DUF1343 domain-containing protein [Acidobacteriota bacterium]
MVRTGLDLLFSDHKKLLSGKRVGLVANPSAIDSSFEFILDLFLAEKSWELGALFGPEHGIRGEMQDQELCDAFEDKSRKLPVFSLYGEHLKPTPDMLKNLDALVFDIQDVGSRYYTFIYTLSYTMEACGENGVEVVVLDRPNPIDGVTMEGPVLEKGFESFVGRFPLPTRHAMTVGELAKYFQGEMGIKCKLRVVEMKGWNRSDYFEATHLPWVLPSPNMPTVDSAVVYPGMCLLEGTNVSEGRGTTRPFEIFGAPWIDPDHLCRRLQEYNLEGCRFRPLFFRPTFNKYQKQLCGGAQIHVTDRKKYKPVFMTLCLLAILMQDYPDFFRWKDPPYEFVHDRLPIDILFGNSWTREMLEAKRPVLEIERKWKTSLDEFKKTREKYIIY